MLSISTTIYETIVLSFFIVLCLSVVIWVLLRWQNFILPVPVQPRTSVTYVNQGSQSMYMTPVHNPFHVKLLEPQAASLQGVDLVLTSKKNYTMQDFWGVQVEGLLQVLQKCCASIRSSMLDGSLLKDCYYYRGSLDSGSACEDEMKQLHPSQRLDKSLIQGRYPLVVFMIQEDIEPCVEPVGWGLIIIIHLKEVISAIETRIVSQYLKLSTGSVVYLNDLLTPLNPEDEGAKLCIVCATNAISIALLPCRHVCLCLSCFQRLNNRCPICRSPIQQYFHVDINSSETNV